LKSDNIVLDRHRDPTPVVIDLGKACYVGEGKCLKLSKYEQLQNAKMCKHIAPEVVQGNYAQSKSSDVYSFGYVVAKTAKHLTNCSHLKTYSDMCMARYEIRPSMVHIQHELKLCMK
jgi:serine/threonine protein kinase